MDFNTFFINIRFKLAKFNENILIYKWNSLLLKKIQIDPF